MSMLQPIPPKMTTIRGDIPVLDPVSIGGQSSFGANYAATPNAKATLFAQSSARYKQQPIKLIFVEEKFFATSR